MSRFAILLKTNGLLARSVAWLHAALILAALVVAVGRPLAAQETGISGQVLDPSGAAISDAKITVTSDSGGTLATLSNAQGSYQVPALRGANYVVRFEAPGFTPAEKTVLVQVGQFITVNVKLQVQSTGSSVNVDATVTEVETTSSQVAGNVNTAQMTKMPLNGRNWMELAMSIPGVVKNDVTYVPTGTTTPGNFQLNVDGQQVLQNSAGAGSGQPTYGPDMVDQFQIITNRFDATQGRSLGIQVNAQTKSGTNQFHGLGFGYFRNSAFNAADPVAHEVLPFSDQQYGGTFGGPILHDKLWFFFGYQAERQPTTIYATPTGFPGETFTFADKLTHGSYLLRFDWQPVQAHRFSLRTAYFSWNEPFSLSGTAYPSRAYTDKHRSWNILADWTWAASPSVVNEVKAGWNHFDWNYTNLVDAQEYRFPSVTLGAPYNYPQVFVQNTQQYRDDLFVLKGSHNIKVGGEFLYTKYSGFFQQNERGTVLTFSSQPSNLAAIFPVWNEPSTWNLAAIAPLATSFAQGIGDFNINIPTKQAGAWIQDDWKILPKLVLNLGLRYDNDCGIFDTQLHLSPNSGVQTPTHGQNFLFSPRLGFAYDLKGDRKTVIRGGAGIYYADINANATIDQQIFNGQTSLQPSIQSSPGNPISLTQPFGNINLNEYLTGQLPIGTQAIQPLAANIRTPYTLQMSLGFERQLAKDWTLSLDYVHFRIYHNWERDDTNLYYNPATGYNVNPSIGGRPNPLYTTIATFETPNAAGGVYDGLNLGIKHRLSKSLTGGVSYTLAKFKDSSGGAFYYANNPFDLAGEWGNSADDQRHTFVTYASYLWKYGLELSGQFHFGSGQAFAVSAAGNPFGDSVSNRLYPTTTPVYNNPANDSASTLPGYDIVARNSLYGNNIYRLDMRLSKTFTVHDRFRFIPIIEAFNLFNHANFGSYQSVVTAAQFDAPAQNTNLAYYPRMLQFAGRFEF